MSTGSVTTRSAAVDAGGTRLHRNALGLPEVVFQGVTHIAPTLNVVFAFPLIALKAGPAMPLSFLLTTIVCLFIGNTVAQFSRYLPSSGGYYSFASRGLGSRVGFMTTWSYLIYDILGPAGAIGFLGYLASNTVDNATGVNIPWWVFTLVTIAIVWSLVHFGVALSMRTTALLGAIEIVIILALAVTFLVRPGAGSSAAAPLEIGHLSNGLHGVLAGMVFSILALSGFEAPAPLAQETRRPGTFISRAVMLSLVLIGVFYVFTSYSTAIGWGTGRMASFASNANPFYALGHSLWGAGWWLIFFAIINSAVSCGLACTNAASRVLYTMGRAGSLPARFGRLNARHRTPAFAIAFAEIVGLIAVVIVALLFGSGNIFGFVGTVTTLAVIVLYICANLALVRYVRREHREDFSVGRHVVAPLVGTVALVPVLFVTVWPVPAYPFKLVPYVFLALLVIGFVFMLVRDRRHPGALDQGASMLVGRSDGSDGEVSWDDADETAQLGRA